MTDAFESQDEPATATGQPHNDNRYYRSSRLGQTAAWVAIVAGVVFVVAVIFFSGLLLGWSSNAQFVWRRGGGLDGTGGSAGTCPMLNSGGMMGPGQMGPRGPMMSPGPSPATTATSTPHP